MAAATTCLGGIGGEDENARGHFEAFSSYSSGVVTTLSSYELLQRLAETDVEKRDS